MSDTRNLTVDVVRGLAIFIMLPANMAALIYAEPHALWFRIFSSFAAPTFVFVSGMMVAFGGTSGKHGLKSYLLRGGLLLIVAALVDVLIWKLIPFYSYDVLYLIGLSCPLAFLFTKLDRSWQLGLLGLILLATPLLQLFFGYTDYPSEIYLWGSDAGTWSVVAAKPTGVLQHLFIDGYFPIFPWLGISFSGVFIAQHFYGASQAGSSRVRVGVAALVLLAVGIAAWVSYPGLHYVRAGYSEMFYPPTVGFILTALGFVLAALWLAHWNPGARIYAPLRWLGEASLFMYVLHYSLIHFLLDPRFPGQPFPVFLLINFTTLLLLLALAGGLHRLKQVWSRRPFLVRFFFGG